MTEYLTLKQIAHELGVSLSRTSYLVRIGKIKHETLTEQDWELKQHPCQKYRISREDLEEYKKKRLEPYIPAPRKTYREAVQKWKAEHPYSSCYACAKDMGITYETALRHWGRHKHNSAPTPDTPQQESQDNQRTTAS